MTQANVKQETLGDLELLREVVELKTRFYPRGRVRYDLAKSGSLKLIPPGRILSEIRKNYASMQEMIFGRRPSFDKIVTGLAALQKEINAD